MKYSTNSRNEIQVRLIFVPYIFLSGFYFVISFSESNHRVHLYLFVKHRGNSSLKVQNINLSKLLTSTIWWQMISSWHEPLFQNNLIIPKIIRGSALLEISDKLNFERRLRSTDPFLKLNIALFQCDGQF